MPVAINTTTPAIAGPPDLWTETFGEPQICVAVLDGWVDRSHPSAIADLVGCVAEQQTHHFVGHLNINP